VKLNGVSTLDDKSSYKMEGSHDGLCVNVCWLECLLCTPKEMDSVSL
jgi:hypothetical protein